MSLASLNPSTKRHCHQKSENSNDVVIFLILLEMCLSVTENDIFYISLFSVRAQLRADWSSDATGCEFLSSASC